jgi:hypothetical protein
MGVFLVGAYQETLGDLHNLLGDTNVVSVKLGANGAVEFAEEVDGRHRGRRAVLRGIRRAGHGGDDAPHGRAGGARERTRRAPTSLRQESFMQSEEVFQVFRDTKALLSGHFELRSGLHSDQYFQCAIVMQYPRIAARLCAALGMRG